MDESLTKIRHERSKKDFPNLTLQEDEYIEYAFKRTRVCLLAIIGGTFAALVAILLSFLFFLINLSRIDDMGRDFLFIILGTLLAAAILISVVSTMVYQGNQLFVTNKRIIQLTMNSPFSRSYNVIDLSSIEDASFHQNGILQNMFHFGTLRLATVGDETSYTFKYSDVKREELEAIQKLISDAKKRQRTRKSRERVEEEVKAAEAVEEADITKAPASPPQSQSDSAES